MTYDSERVFNTLDSRSSKRADALHKTLQELGISFATGVPCGVLRHIIQHVQEDPKIQHVPANRESEAVGLAAGAYFAGKTPLVYMQNSGLFAASNDIGSLLIPYRMPILFVVSYRGCEGEDAVQHVVTGHATEPLLNAFGVPYVVYETQDISSLAETLFADMQREQLPGFLILKRGWQL